MKFTRVLLAGTALVSASAIAAGNQSQQRSESGAQKEQRAQSSSGASQRSRSNHSPQVIKQVQEKLSAAGHDAGPADGKIGPQTQQAIMSFQGTKGLEASGQLDNDTLTALQVDPAQGSASAGSSSSPAPQPKSSR